MEMWHFSTFQFLQYLYLYWHRIFHHYTYTFTVICVPTCCLLSRYYRWNFYAFDLGVSLQQSNAIYCHFLKDGGLAILCSLIISKDIVLSPIFKKLSWDLSFSLGDQAIFCFLYKKNLPRSVSTFYYFQIFSFLFP